MSKRQSFRNQMGTALGDSIGIRDGETTLPVYSDRPGAPPKTAFVRSRSVGEIEVEEIIPDPDQPRKEFSEDEIARLAADIQSRGQLQPIRVRWSEMHARWIIVAGERRWRAHKHAGLSKITCTFIDREMSDNEIRSEQLVENLLREDLKGIELAKAFSALMEASSWSAKQLAEQLNVSKGKVSKALSLLKLPEDLQAKVEDGTISPSTAYELAKVKDEKKQRELADQAIAGHVTQVEAARSTKRAEGAERKKRRSTNETFRTTDGVKLVITSRRDIGPEGMIAALIEVADQIRKRSKTKAA